MVFNYFRLMVKVELIWTFLRRTLSYWPCHWTSNKPVFRPVEGMLAQDRAPYQRKRILRKLGFSSGSWVWLFSFVVSTWHEASPRHYSTCLLLKVKNVCVCVRACVKISLYIYYIVATTIVGSWVFQRRRSNKGCGSAILICVPRVGTKVKQRSTWVLPLMG